MAKALEACTTENGLQNVSLEQVLGEFKLHANPNAKPYTIKGLRALLAKKNYSIHRGKIVPTQLVYCKNCRVKRSRAQCPYTLCCSCCMMTSEQPCRIHVSENKREMKQSA